MNAKQTALDAYLARTAAIHVKLERLQQLADDHFDHALDAVTKRDATGGDYRITRLILYQRGCTLRSSSRRPLKTRSVRLCLPESALMWRLIIFQLFL